MHPIVDSEVDGDRFRTQLSSYPIDTVTQHNADEDGNRAAVKILL